MKSFTPTIPKACSVAAAVVALVAMTGCVEHEVVVGPVPVFAPVAEVATVPAVDPAVVVLKEAPPPPRFEEMTARPSSDHVWIPGYWAWHAGQQEWHSGHWEIPPRPGAKWTTSRWERQGDGYVFVQGFWQ